MLQEADYGLTEQAHVGDTNRYNGDEGLLVRFYMHPKHDTTKSKEAGRPIYTEVPYIQIMQPGNKDSMIARPARDMDISRFPRHWQAFKSRQSEDYVEGTLLEEWPGINRSQVEELKYFNIRTVEQLLEVSDSNSQKIMGFNLLKQRAKAFLEASEKEHAAEVIQEREAQIQQLMESNAQLQERLEALEKAADDED